MELAPEEVLIEEAEWDLDKLISPLYLPLEPGIFDFQGIVGHGIDDTDMDPLGFCSISHVCWEMKVGYKSEVETTENILGEMV